LTINYDEYIKKFDSCVSKYIPKINEWTPADYAVYGPKDLFKVPLNEAKELQFNAIKYQFKRHFEQNKMYHTFCKDMKVVPDDIKIYDDLEKIPLIPNEFYKDYPNGRDFAHWLANIFTGDIPQVKINGMNPSFDDVINAFNASGLAVSYSSGTSGRHTFIPRDMRTFYISEYSAAKMVVSMIYPIWDYDMNGYLLMPNPFKTNVYAGKVCTIYYDAIKNVEVAIDREINTELIKLSMTGGKGIKTKLVKSSLRRMNKRIIDNIIRWLEKNDKERNKIAFVGAPYILYMVTNKLKEDGKTFNFADRGAVLTGGGWKVQENSRMPLTSFRKQMEETLGIKQEHCLDIYGMVEGNAWTTHCQEGHYLHIPISYIHPMVLDKEFKPVGYNESGQFAFLDGSSFSYPAFIISGDQVHMLEHCPVCDRPGPVLEPEVTRSAGKEMRGCAEEIRKMISNDVKG
jgi:hypothetical protein